LETLPKIFLGVGGEGSPTPLPVTTLERRNVGLQNNFEIEFLANVAQKL